MLGRQSLVAPRQRHSGKFRNGNRPFPSRLRLPTLAAVHVEWQAHDKLVRALLERETPNCPGVTLDIGAPDRRECRDGTRGRVANRDSNSSRPEIDSQKPRHGAVAAGEGVAGETIETLIRAGWSGSRSTNSGQTEISGAPYA